MIAPTPWERLRSRRWNISISLRVLKWLAVVIPILFLVIVDVLRRTVYSDQPYPFTGLPGLLFAYALISVSVALFSHAIFTFISRLQGKIMEQNRRLSALNSLASATAEKLDLEDILSAGLDHVLDAMNADKGLICLVDLEEEEHSAVCIRGLSDEFIKRVQRAKLRDDPVALEVVRTGRPVVFEKVFEDPEVRERAKREGIRSGISAPLTSEGEVNGILMIATRVERQFSGADQEFLDGVGGHLGLAIRSAVLYEQSQLQNRELSALLAVGKAVTSSLDLDEAVGTSLDTIIEVTSADAAEVWLTDGDGALVLLAHRGAGRDAFLELDRLGVGEGIPGIAARNGERIIVHDLPSDPRIVRKKLTTVGFHTFCALPMHYRGRLVGVLTVAALSEDSMREPWELHLLDGIGERVTLAIENSQLHQQVQDVAVVQERERIAREMHDGLGQVLGYINTQTLAVKKLISSDRFQEATVELTGMGEVARDLYADVREGILGLRTAPHRDGGLVPALQEYVERYGEVAAIDAKLEVSDETESLRLPPSAEVQLMRIIQEALSNVRKHANAKSAYVRLGRNGTEFEVEVVDDGRGFDPTGVRSSGWPRFGLQTMRERAESVGGSFTIETAPGRGTRVIVRIPVKVGQPSGERV